MNNKLVPSSEIQFIDGKKEFFSPTILHPGKEFQKVVSEILDAYPEQSFCFLDEGRLRNQVGIFRDHFLQDDDRRVLAYAVKANPRRKILEILYEEGVTNFDCSSLEEIFSVLTVDPENTALFNHPFKTREAIAVSSQMGVHYFTVQDQRQVQKIMDNLSQSVSKKIDIAVRLKTPNPRARINLSDKFGIDAAEVGQILHFIRAQTDFIPGISMHTGSQNSEPSTYADAIQLVADILQKERGARTINLGGGFPINYFEEDSYDIREYFHIINAAIRQYLHPLLMDDSHIIIEPGRALVAEAINLIIRVLGTSQGQLHTTDGIYSCFIDAAVHGWRYNFQPFSTGNRQFDSRKINWAQLFGPTCDSGDVLEQIELPCNMQEGDSLLVRNAGAYTDSVSTNFNGFGPPWYVLYNPTSPSVRSSLLNHCVLEPKGHIRKLLHSAETVEVGSERYFFQNLVSGSLELTTETIREIAAAFREIFSNDWPEFAACFECSAKLPQPVKFSAHEILHSADSYISLPQMESIIKLPPCLYCNQPMEFFIDQEKTFQKLSLKFSKNAFVTLLRNKETSQILGFTFACLCTLREAFNQEEWRHPYAYAARQDPQYERPFGPFLELLAPELERITSQSVTAETKIFLSNCVAIKPHMRGQGYLSRMMSSFYHMIPIEMYDVPVLGQTTKGSKFHHILKAAGLREIEGFLPAGQIFMCGHHGNFLRQMLS